MSLLITHQIDNTPKISVITQIELLRFTASGHIQKTFTSFVEECIVFSLDEQVVQKTITICRQRRIKLPDAIIAATAVVHQLVLVTRNISDFSNIKGLKLFNPWETVII